MTTTTNIRTGRHCTFNMHVHLVFVTKYLKRVFAKSTLDLMKQVFEDVAYDFESELVEFDGEKDHVHLLIHYPPKISVSKLVNSLKGILAMRMKNYDAYRPAALDPKSSASTNSATSAFTATNLKQNDRLLTHKTRLCHGREREEHYIKMSHLRACHEHKYDY